MAMAIVGNFVTTSEAAAMLNVGEERVRQFHRTGRLHGRKVGISIIFDRAEVEEFAKQERPTGRPKQENEPEEKPARKKHGR